MKRFVASDPRYRTVPEATVVELLFVNHWAYAVNGGERPIAEREARQAVDRWTGLGLPYSRSPTGERLFDPVEVVNFSSWAGACCDDPIEDRHLHEARRMVRDLHAAPLASPGPPPIAELRPLRFAVRFRREFNLANIPIGARIRLRAPAPIADETLRDLRITPFADDGLDVDYSLAPGRLDARIVPPPSHRVTVGFEATFTAHPGLPGGAAPALAADERDLFTQPRDGLIQITPRIRALAAEIAGEERDDWSVVGRIWRYLAERMGCGEVHYDQAGRIAPLDWALDSGWIDCQLGSALIAGLCRARGIPTRLVSGYMLYPAAPTQHYWLEVWTSEQGWTPLDRYSWNLGGAEETGWRDHFFGAVDYRMKTQSLPRLFNSGGDVRLPSSWSRLYRIVGDGVETSYHDRETGSLIYSDHFAVTSVGDSGAAR